MNNNTGDNMNEHTTSDLAGLAAREAGAPARGPTRIEEIRARVEAATMGAGLDKFGSAIVDDFGRCVVCGKWTNPGHDDAQSHKDGCAARREEVRYAQALHAIYRTGADDLRHLLNELAGYQSDLLAGERALKEARRERDALTADLARARRILAVEQGREGPEGWTYNFASGRWEREGAAVWRASWLRGHQRGDFIAWCWEVWTMDERFEGTEAAALDALEAADRVLR